MNERLFHSAKEAQETARQWRRWANDYDDAWRAKCLAEAKRAFHDARLWLRMARPMNLEQHHE